MPQDWGRCPGREYHLVAGSSGLLTATNAHELADYGWTTTALSLVAGSGADLGSSADESPPYLDFDAAGDLLLSPLVFGNYSHIVQARMFGADAVSAPVLALDAWASWPVTSGLGETNTGLGFSSGDPVTTTLHTAFIASNGANWRIRNQGGGDVGPVCDAGWHLFSIRVDSAQVLWYVDGVLQGNLATDGDLWPTAFGVRVAGGAVNRVRLAWAKISYLRNAEV